MLAPVAISVVLGEDSFLVREGLRQVLAGAPQVQRQWDESRSAIAESDASGDALPDATAGVLPEVLPLAADVEKWADRGLDDPGQASETRSRR